MFTLNTRDPSYLLRTPVMTHPRTPFTSRDAWHFAVASAYPRHTTALHVLCEARITDGAVIAEWDAATNTGWMRAIVVPQAVPATDGHAGYLGEAGKTAATPIDWKVGTGDWDAAKAEGRRIFAAYNKPGNTDAVLALKTAAGAAQKAGSYLGAVVVGLCNDWFDAQR